MELKLKKSEQERKKILDTLELKILSFESTLKSKKNITDDEIAYSRSLRIQFEKKNNEFENDTRNQVAEYDKLIIKQMSQYIQDYGEKNGFKFIFGRTEDNVLLYGNESCDVTKEVSAFINEKFNGK
jgi:Skp family chaperone for outer membrane proteins